MSETGRMTLTDPPPIPLLDVEDRAHQSPFGSRWLICALFIGIPAWWLLGAAGFVAPVLALFVGIGLLVRTQVVVPRGFGLWLLFLACVLISMLQVPDLARGVAAGYRFAHYLAAGIFFVYVFNARRDRLPIESVVRVIGLFWVIVVLGGVVGMLAPSVTFRTPVAATLPQALVQEGFVSDLVTASTSSENPFAGLGLHRPKAPFPYTNQWGATYALSLPLAIAAVGMARTPLQRKGLLLLLMISTIPLVFSLDRGAWLSASLGLLYAAGRLFLVGRARSTNVPVVLIGVTLTAVMLLATPLKDVVLVRIDRGYGDTDRLYLYSESIRLAEESPLFGHGAPVEVSGIASVGTHGHLWTVLVSFGFVGVAVFIGWLLKLLFATWRSPPGASRTERSAVFWCNVAIFIAIVQLPYYELLPWGLPIVMIVAAAAWRERLAVGRR